MWSKYSTRTIFADIMKFLRCDLLCDIGAMDGEDSLFFSKKFPWITVAAIEANPDNLEKIQRNKELVNNLRVFNFALSNKNGLLKFYTFESTNRLNMGTGSTLRRLKDKVSNELEVTSMRFDDFINRNFSNKSNIALWVDVEGAAFQVFEGIGKANKKISVIHVELEEKPVYEEQKLKKEVIELLSESGFTEIARSYHRNSKVSDVIFVDKNKLNLKTKTFVLFSKFKSNSSYLYLRLKNSIKT